jgi:hypothetical protein
MATKRHLRSAGRWLAAGAGVAASYAICAATTWHRYGRTRPAAAKNRDALLDQFMPTYHDRSRCPCKVPAVLGVRVSRHHPDSVGVAPTAESRGRTSDARWSAALTRTVLKGIAVWCCIIAVEALHGIVRTMFLAPMVGDFRARQIAVFTGSCLVLIVAMLFIRWIRPAGAREAWFVGFVWLVLTLAFEVAFGRYVVRAPWSRIASDYNLLRGGLLPIGLFVLTAAPVIAARVRPARASR